MKFLGTILVFLCGLLVLSGSAVAYMIGDINVGDLDKVVASASLGNSSDAAEVAWIRSVLGNDYAISSKYDVNESNWTQTDAPSVYAIGLNGSPGYFFIKLGTGNTSIASHWLYENFNNFMYAVVSLSQWGFEANNIEIGRISHVGDIGAAPVPEPASMLLFGTGLVVFGIARKLKKI